MIPAVDFETFSKILNRPGGFREPGEPEEYCRGFQVFDKDMTGFIGVGQLRYILTNLGEKMSDEEVDELLKAVDTSSGEINYTGMFTPTHPELRDPDLDRTGAYWDTRLTCESRTRTNNPRKLNTSKLSKRQTWSEQNILGGMAFLHYIHGMDRGLTFRAGDGVLRCMKY